MPLSIVQGIEQVVAWSRHRLAFTMSASWFFQFAAFTQGCVALKSLIAFSNTWCAAPDDFVVIRIHRMILPSKKHDHSFPLPAVAGRGARS